MTMKELPSARVIIIESFMGRQKKIIGDGM